MFKFVKSIKESIAGEVGLYKVITTEKSASEIISNENIITKVVIKPVKGLVNQIKSLTVGSSESRSQKKATNVAIKFNNSIMDDIEMRFSKADIKDASKRVDSINKNSFNKGVDAVREELKKSGITGVPDFVLERIVYNTLIKQDLEERIK